MTNPSRHFDLSIEVFPPRDLIASFNLWQTIDALCALSPEFVSVTYGAGGSTKENTSQAINAIHTNYRVPVAGHLTCLGTNRDAVLNVAQKYWEKGARRLVALRGDAPRQGTSTPDAEGFADPTELIAAVKQLYDFEIYVAAYPTPHPLAQSADACVDFLKRKFDAGADAAITQFFFEAEDFLRFRDRCSAAGIENPIIPGILPIENWTKTKGFAQKCGVPVPKLLDETFAKADTRERHDLLAIAAATELCDTLLEEGVENLHFYSLNRADLTLTICKALGRVPEEKAISIAS
ncbi:MAG: methylenetetrahydrofolate reductase [Pseudomonadota bacterium]